MKNKKILFLLHLPPPVHGSSTVGLYIKKSLEINKKFNCVYINIGTSASINEIGKKPMLKASRYLKILFLLLKNLIINRPNICYLAITARGVAFYKDALLALIIKLFRVKIVYHFHNKGVKINSSKKINNFLYNSVFKNTDAILLSKYLYTDINKYFSTQRVQYCPNGVPESKNPEFSNYKKDGDYVKILFLSNLIKTKGVIILLEACKILKDKKLNFKCTLVGGIGDISKQNIKKLINDLDLNEHVKYVGKKFGKEKALEFISSDVFVLPTFYPNECFPLTLIEAMQFQLPVISTVEGGIRDIVDDNTTGFLVKRKDAISLAEKLEFLINNPKLRSSMGKAGKLKYKKELTINHFEKNLVNVLEKTIEKNEN